MSEMSILQFNKLNIRTDKNLGWKEWKRGGGGLKYVNKLKRHEILSVFFRSDHSLFIIFYFFILPGLIKYKAKVEPGS